MLKRLAKFEPARLTQARIAKKLSVPELAERVGVTRQAMSAYERGVMQPTPETLRDIATQLDAPEAYFAMGLYPEEAGLESTINFRKLAAAVRRSREQARVYLEWCVALHAFCAERVEMPNVSVPTFDIPDFTKLTEDDIEALAEQTRRFWRLGDGPISDLTLLLENNGVAVSYVDLDAGMDGLSAWYASRPRILVSRKAYWARARFDLAHELGHLVLHRSSTEADLENLETHALMEGQAHRFAQAFLLPERTFAPEVYSFDLRGLEELKRRWGVSMQAIVMRLRALHFIDEHQTTRMFKLFNFHGIRRKEPLDDSIQPERGKVMRRIVDYFDNNKILLKQEFLVRTRIPHWFTLQVLDLPGQAFEPPSAGNVIDFATATAQRKGQN